MDTKTNYHIPRKLPKSERRVRFADTMGMELVSIFLIDLISNYYFASQKALQAPPAPTIINRYNKQQQASSIQAKSSSISTPSSQTSTTTNNNNHYNTNTNHYHYNHHQQQHSHHSQAHLHQSQLQHNHHHHHQHHHQHHQHQNGITNSNANTSNQTPAIHFNYACDFIQPISLISFKERVRLNKVQLETCQVSSTAGHVSVSCTIRVLNQSYDKAVIVRYTTDEWHTYTDSLASYKPGSCDGWSDKFTSTFSLTNQVKSFTTGQRIIFAIQFKYGGDNVFWDNNGGRNYSIKKM